MPVFQQIKFKYAFSKACVFTVEKHQTSHFISLARMNLGTHFMIRLCQNNSTVSALMSCFCDMSMQDRKWSG